MTMKKLINYQLDKLKINHKSRINKISEKISPKCDRSKQTHYYRQTREKD
jgi:hypothetical protein